MRKCICSLLVVGMLLSLAGCSLPSYEDTNGATDYSLQTITDQDIIGGIHTFKTMSSTVTVNKRTTCKTKTMSGVDSLFEKRLNNGTLDMTVSCEITKGNARLVLVIDDKIVHDFALNEADQHITLNNITGKVYLKIAGESAGYKVTYELK